MAHVNATLRDHSIATQRYLEGSLGSVLLCRKTEQLLWGWNSAWWSDWEASWRRRCSTCEPETNAHPTQGHELACT